MVAVVNETLIKMRNCAVALKARRKLQVELSKYPTKKVRSANAVLNRKYGLAMMSSLSEYDFKRMFRLGREEFGELARSIALKLSINVLQGQRSSGSAVSVTTRLSCTLRWLAGGSYHDICRLFGVSHENFFHERGILWTTIEAIDDLFTIGMSLEENALEKASIGFSKCCKNRIHGCVLAIDGWVCKTRQPTAKEVNGNIMVYMRIETAKVVGEYLFWQAVMLI